MVNQPDPKSAQSFVDHLQSDSVAIRNAVWEIEEYCAESFGHLPKIMKSSCTHTLIYAFTVKVNEVGWSFLS